MAHNEIQLAENNDNFLHLIEFYVLRTDSLGVETTLIYGVDVTKSIEILNLPKFKSFFSNVQEVIGLFEHRGSPVPIINLSMLIGADEIKINPNSQLLIMEFDDQRVGFIVDSSEKIRKVKRNKVYPPFVGCLDSITGVTVIENDRFMFVLDLELILKNITKIKKMERSISHPKETPSISPVQHLGFINEVNKINTTNTTTRSNRNRVLLVDNSSITRKTIIDMLVNYNLDIIEANSGIEALNFIEQFNQQIDPNKRAVDLLIANVEMPAMDGYKLIKKVKSEKRYKNIFTIVHSALADNINAQKCIESGCDFYLIEFNKNQIINAVEEALKLTHQAAA